MYVPVLPTSFDLSDVELYTARIIFPGINPASMISYYRSRQPFIGDHSIFNRMA